LSRLCDPRCGRGFYNSFHASIPFLRWSLDHIFHSSDFAVARMQRMRYFGSDHFPIFVHLRYENGNLTHRNIAAMKTAAGSPRVPISIRDDRSDVPDIATPEVQAALQSAPPAELMTTPQSPLPDAPKPVAVPPTPPHPIAAVEAASATDTSAVKEAEQGTPGIRAQTRGLSTSDRVEADTLIQQATDRAPNRPPPPAPKDPAEATAEPAVNPRRSPRRDD
jgi:hypothetical protein